MALLAEKAVELRAGQVHDLLWSRSSVGGGWLSVCVASQQLALTPGATPIESALAVGQSAEPCLDLARVDGARSLANGRETNLLHNLFDGLGLAQPRPNDRAEPTLVGPELIVPVDRRAHAVLGSIGQHNLQGAADLGPGHAVCPLGCRDCDDPSTRVSDFGLAPIRNRLAQALGRDRPPG